MLRNPVAYVRPLVDASPSGAARSPSVHADQRPAPRLAAAVLAALALAATGALPATAEADATPQALPFAQDWSDTGLLAVDDDWSAVPGVVGYRGDGSTTAAGADPQGVTADGSEVVDVNANELNPNAFFVGGVAEFELTDPVVALQGTGSADAPHLLLRLSTSGRRSVRVAYTLRDIDGSADDAVQQVALQYRVGGAGDYTNVPAGYVADATAGPGLAGLATAVSATLPPEADDQPLVEVRVITANAADNDELVGADDIAVDAAPIPVDRDGDGVADGDDNCPDSTNPAQEDADGADGGDACDPDDDNDGLTDVVEAARGSSCLDLDSDDDGLGDAAEVNRTRTNPVARDSDADRLTDGLERGLVRGIADPPGAVRGTHQGRFRADSHPATRTNARASDSDADRLADGREDRNRNGRREKNETDPRRRDTDGDGVSDSRDAHPLRSG